MTSTLTRSSIRPGAVGAVVGGGTGVLVAAEFVPAGVLPQLAADLGVTEGRAGLAVAATALAGALTAPSIASVIPRADRRRVLITLLALAVVSNLMVALAPSFAVLLLGRVVLGVALAGFWALAFAVGVRVVDRPALIATSLAVGTSFSTIIAVPMASIIAGISDWRYVFVLLAVLSAGVMIVLARVLPPVPAMPAAGAAMMLGALRNPALVIGVGVVGIAAFANFTAYPYIRVAIGEIAPGAVAGMLLAWGVGGLAGNLIAGRLSERLRLGLVVGPLLLALALAGIAQTSSAVVLALAVTAWGIGFNLVPVLSQLWVARIEPERTESAVSLQVTSFQVAIMAGSVVGGLIVDGSGHRVAIALGAAAAAVAALGFSRIRMRPRA